MTMLKETQNIEFKSAWRGEHLKWICGFANAQGGSLFVGIEKMCAACKSHNAPEPQYLVHSNDIMILFKASGKYLELANNKAKENYPENCTTNCPEIALRTFAAIVENPNITIAQLTETTQLSKRAVNYHIKLLKENGLIKHIGSNKTGYWEVVTTPYDTKK